MTDIRALAHECGAVSYTPGPMRAVRGVSLTFEQLDALAARLATHPTEPVAAHGAQSAPAGFALVPAEATEDMKSAAVRYLNGDEVYKNVAAGALRIEEEIYGEVYAAMIAAAPAQPAAGLVGLTDDEVMGCMHYDMLVFARQLNESFAEKNGLVQAAHPKEQTP